MIRLRVLCPADDAAGQGTGSAVGGTGIPAMADGVLAVLAAEPGAAHVVHLPGAAVAPAGDVVEADLARESSTG